MMPPENNEVDDRDFRYSMLLEQLETSQISDTEAPHLHMWLSHQAGEQLQQLAISSAIGAESLADQIKICTMLAERASATAEQFWFLNQFSALDFALAQAFHSIQQGMASDTTLPSPMSEKWTKFRERQAMESTLLAKTARDALENLKGIQSKKGRPAKVWRNQLFVELFDRLLQLHSRSREDCIDLATGIWNVYFPDDEISDPDTAGRIITREQKSRKTHGQNTA